MLDYSEYKSIIDVLDKSELDNTYKDLIKKEDKVLDTVNNIVTHIKERENKEKQFLHMSMFEIYNLFFVEFHEVIKDIMKAKGIEDVINILLKGHRPIYIGCVLILVSIILFFIENSK